MEGSLRISKLKKENEFIILICLTHEDKAQAWRNKKRGGSGGRTKERAQEPGNEKARVFRSTSGFYDNRTVIKDYRLLIDCLSSTH